MSRKILIIAISFMMLFRQFCSSFVYAESITNTPERLFESVNKEVSDPSVESDELIIQDLDDSQFAFMEDNDIPATKDDVSENSIIGYVGYGLLFHLSDSNESADWGFDAEIQGDSVKYIDCSNNLRVLCVEPGNSRITVKDKAGEIIRTIDISVLDGCPDVDVTVLIGLSEESNTEFIGEPSRNPDEYTCEVGKYYKLTVDYTINDQNNYQNEGDGLYYDLSEYSELLDPFFDSRIGASGSGNGSGVFMSVMKADALGSVQLPLPNGKVLKINIISENSIVGYVGFTLSFRLSDSNESTDWKFDTEIQGESVKIIDCSNYLSVLCVKPGNSQITVRNKAGQIIRTIDISVIDGYPDIDVSVLIGLSDGSITEFIGEPSKNPDEYTCAIGKTYTLIVQYSLNDHNNYQNEGDFLSYRFHEYYELLDLYFDDINGGSAGTVHGGAFSTGMKATSVGSIQLPLPNGKVLKINIIAENPDHDLTNAYAVLTDEGELVFFRSYDSYNNRSTGTFSDVNGTQYIGKVYSDIETSLKPWSENSELIKSVRVADGQRISRTSLRLMFYGCSNLATANLNGFDTSNVSDMSAMFDYCSSLTALDLSVIDTSNVINMNAMFANCNLLSNLNLDGIDTSKVTDMSWLFSNCNSLTDLDVSGFDTSNVMNMSFMFSDCYKLTNLDISKFETSNVSDMRYMFKDCSSLVNIDVSGFETSRVIDMSFMFYGCRALNNLDISSFNTSNVCDFSYMFSACQSLNKLDMKNFDTHNANNMAGMFGACTSLKEIDLSSFDTSQVTNMSQMFSNCSSLVELNIYGLNTSNVTNMNNMFGRCYSLEALDLSGFDTSNVTNMSGMFARNEKLKEINLSSFDTSKITNMENMFESLLQLSRISLGNKFSIWNSNSDFPGGKWINKELNISLSGADLCKQYPSHKNEWAGIWEKDDGKPRSIQLNMTDAAVVYNNTVKLTATVGPETASDKFVIWTSSDESVSTVNSNGLVTGKKVGTAIITATTVNGLTATCKVSVLFTDVADALKFFYNPVYWAVDNDITTGTSPATFSPNEKVTRGQIVSFLYRAAGSPAVSGNMPFDDVKAGKYYYNAVLWAKNNSITTGTSSTQFSPNENCTRAQIVTLLWRYLNSPEPSKIANFDDVATGAFYQKAVSWAAENNITTGTAPTRFSPNESCTRGQAVTFIFRAISN